MTSRFLTLLLLVGLSLAWQGCVEEEEGNCTPTGPFSKECTTPTASTTTTSTSTSMTTSTTGNTNRPDKYPGALNPDLKLSKLDDENVAALCKEIVSYGPRGCRVVGMDLEIRDNPGFTQERCDRYIKGLRTYEMIEMKECTISVKEFYQAFVKSPCENSNITIECSIQ